MNNSEWTFRIVQAAMEFVARPSTATRAALAEDLRQYELDAQCGTVKPPQVSVALGVPRTGAVAAEVVVILTTPQAINRWQYAATE